MRKDDDSSGPAPIIRSSLKRPISFLDDWPEPPKAQCLAEVEEPGLTEAKRLRIQILLACNPYGIPMSVFAEYYEKMFGVELNPQAMGFVDLSAMVQNLSDLFTVQKPDEVTAVLFPDHSYDFIIHDARLLHNFTASSQDGSDDELEDNHDNLIDRASLEQDEDFPPDVVLTGEQYECIFPVSLAKLEGTCGLYQGTILGVASPESFFIKLNLFDRERIIKLSAEISKYFMTVERSIDAYSVPKDFLYTGFPCLSYVGRGKAWERCLIVGRAKNNKILVESVDFGGVYAVNRLHLYLIPRKFFELPRQTLRANLPGLIPSKGLRSWPKKVGSRMRCFSFEGYSLDILLMNNQDDKTKNSTTGSTESNSGPCSPDSELKIPPKRKSTSRGPQYDAIIVDRNDDELDIYLDEILVLETYANLKDSDKMREVHQIKQQLRDALKDIPRPVNPFKN